jgi:hypothetical protein
MPSPKQSRQITKLWPTAHSLRTGRHRRRRNCLRTNCWFGAPHSDPSHGASNLATVSSAWTNLSVAGLCRGRPPVSFSHRAIRGELFAMSDRESNAGDQYSATGTKQRTARPPNTSANQTTPLLVGLPYWRTTASSGTSYHSLLKRTQ